jgi:hypothetical protein
VATDLNAAAADTHVDGDPFAEDPKVDNDEHPELLGPPRPCRPFNRHGMGGNQNHHNQYYVRNDDPFAKVKFSISPFNGSYDTEAYLDWEMLSKSLVPTLFLNNIMLGKPLVSLKILLLSGGMNWLPLGYNHIHGMG